MALRITQLMKVGRVTAYRTYTSLYSEIRRQFPVLWKYINVCNITHWKERGIRLQHITVNLCLVFIPIPLISFCCILSFWVIPRHVHMTYEDETDRGFLNLCTKNSKARYHPKETIQHSRHGDSLKSSW